MWQVSLATGPKVRDESQLALTKSATDDVAIDARRTELRRLYFKPTNSAINGPNDV